MFLPTDDDGVGYVTSPNYHYGMHMDIYADLQVKDQTDLIKKYRKNAATHPEVDMAIEEIVNEAIVMPQDDDKVVEVNLENVQESRQGSRRKSFEEFDNDPQHDVLQRDDAHDMFRNLVCRRSTVSPSGGRHC